MAVICLSVCLSVPSGVGSNLQVGGTMPARSAGRKFFDVPPHFSLVPPHEGAQRLFVSDRETIEVVKSGEGQ